jgi:hypothetical protein
MVGVRAVPLQTDFCPVAWPNTGLVQVIRRCHERTGHSADNKGWRSGDWEMGQAGQRGERRLRRILETCVLP